MATINVTEQTEDQNNSSVKPSKFPSLPRLQKKKGVNAMQTIQFM